MNTDAHAFWSRGLSLGLALGVHGLLIGGSLLWWPVQEAATETATTTTLVMVDISIAPVPPTPPAPPAVPPPPLLPSPATPTIPEPLPLPEPSVQAALDQVPPERGETPAPEPALEQPPEVSMDAPVQTDAAAPPAAIQRNTSPQAVMSWQQQLLAHLQHYRRYPSQSRRLRQEGIAYVRFSVDRQGRISHPRIERTSEHRLLDEETIATVHRANPVPPPPVEIPGNPVDVVVPVSFHLRKR